MGRIGAGFAMGLILDLPVAMADGLRCLLCMVVRRRSGVLSMIRRVG